MALKKSQLYRSLWASCDELRGGMDASQYKDYILTLLFMKYATDKYAGKDDAMLEVPEGGSFTDIVKLRGDKEIGEKMNIIISKMAEANGLMDVITLADFNDENKVGKGQAMQDRLSKLVAIFDAIDFRTNRAEGDDLLGDAYEYLMRNFATESGKSKGQFYTPAEVSRVMAKVVGIGPQTDSDHTIYDPTCGSGSLLLKAADEAPRGMTIYGQEMDFATWAMARMNMFLHGEPTHELARDNTLSDPEFKHADGSLMRFDFAVANPPFSSKAWSSGIKPEEDEFGRFDGFGVPPAKNGDYAFLLHMVKSLNANGKGAIILPHGVLFRGNKEADIRRNLVRRGLIKGIIGLPPNLFYGTGIPACIIVIDKEHAQARTGIFMIDASRGFMKDGNKNRLRAQDIHRIVDVFNRQIEQARYSRMVPLSEIADPANDYNLNIPRYIDASEPEDLHDLHAHLNGGIPDHDIDALHSYWSVMPGLRHALFSTNGHAGYSTAIVPTAEVKPTIVAHSDWTTFAARVADVFGAWRAANAPTLRAIKINDVPREIIAALSEDLLARFASVQLVDHYDVYQRVMDYWAETMQDDVYLIAADGWAASACPRLVIEDDDRKIRETPDLVLGKKKYKMDLVPPTLVSARFFAADLEAADQSQASVDAAERAFGEFMEEHSGEDGLLAEATTEKGTISRMSVSERIRQVERDANLQTADADNAEELEALHHYLELSDARSDAELKLKKAQVKLRENVLKRYETLTTDEIIALVVDDKWFAALHAAVQGEVERLTQRLAGRVRELEERYDEPLPVLEQHVETYSAKVAAHLAKMGLVLA